ncbi:MAG: HD-GYP domain-containing protein [Nitrospirota bacterium]
MDKIKKFLFNKFEFVSVITILIILTVISIFVVNKYPFLNFYYIPVLIAGYNIGKRGAVLSGVFAVSMELLLLIIFPDRLSATATDQLRIYLDFGAWGGFLILSGYVVGILYEEREKQFHSIRTAYIGVVEILTKYIESVDRYTKGHSVRVAELSLEIAIAMGIRRDECENIKVGALLHDIGKIEISTDLIKKAADLSMEERETMNTHASRGANLLSKVGSVLSGAIPIVLAHHEYFNNNGGMSGKDHKTNNIPLGARIIAVADTYDAIVTDRPYRKGRHPWEALEEIKKGSGSQFDPEVVDAFQRVVKKHIED